MSFLIGSFRRTRGLRIRPLPEQEVCFVYTPRKPNLYTLNATAWVILELCDGRSLEDIKEQFYGGIEPLMSREEAADYVLASVKDFIEKSIVESC